jgi:hypothetical protein
MPLQSRVDPFGTLFAAPGRGLLMGNRGGRIHDPATQHLTGRSHASRRWICCVLSFRGRKRAVWGNGYTELFFADEASALAAGHRPCFECRRSDAIAFQARFPRTAEEAPPGADAMDLVLHAQRMAGDKPALVAQDIRQLPDGAMVAKDRESFVVRAGAAYPWAYTGTGKIPVKLLGATLLTPPAIVATLAAGYFPLEFRPAAR